MTAVGLDDLHGDPFDRIIVATDDDSGGRSFACGSPTTTFQMPNHGTLVASGTLTFFGHTFPFTNKTLHF